MANTLSDLRSAFGIPDSVVIVTALNFQRTPPITTKKSPDYNIDNTDTRDEPLSYRSQLGTPVYTNIEFLFGEYETNTKGVFKSFGSQTDSPDKLRYEAVLITVSQAKKIIKTEIQGRDGTVKEYIGLDDYQVTVNGILTGKNGNRPLDQIYALKKMLDAPIPIQVASEYLQTLGINWLVLEGYEIGEQEGSYSYQTFSLSFLSDIQQELELTNL